MAAFGVDSLAYIDDSLDVLVYLGVSNQSEELRAT
jgi:hypothetical protein